MPVVSIVVPYFSHQDFLLESVRSALAQTCADIEVICVDDASPVAKAGDILSGLDDRRLKIIQRKENGGSAAAKNTGIRESSAQLLVPLDSDDLLAPDYVEVTLERLEREPDAGGVYTQTLVFGQQNFLHSPDCSIATILARQPVPTTCLLRREVWERAGGYAEKVYHDDDDFWLTAMELGYRFVRVDRPLYSYRKHKNGKSQRRQTDMIPSLVARHKESFERFLPLILETAETRYFELEGKYQLLYDCYQELADDHRKLGEYVSWLENQQQERKECSATQRQSPAQADPMSLIALGLKALSRWRGMKT